MKTNDFLRKQNTTLLEELNMAKDNIKSCSRLNRLLNIVAITTTLGVVTSSTIAYVGYQKFNEDISLKAGKISELTLKTSDDFKVIDELLKSKSFVSVTETAIMQDLKDNYPELSMKTKVKIIKAIMEESARYSINPLLLYAVCHVESSFRPWLEHELRVITVNGKQIKARCVGLMGISWENHKDLLRTSGIVESRGDLFDPVNNIKAGALILNEYFQMDMLKGAKTKDESALLRYFGGNFPVYVQRVEAKMFDVIRPGLYRKD